jgi:thioredoxin-related protein
MNRSLVVFVITLTVVCSVAACFAQPRFLKPAAKASTAKVEWHSDLKAAHKVAVSRDRPILVVVGGPACAYCKLLEKNTLGDAGVSESINKHFIAVHLDFEKDRKVCEALEIESLPTTLVLSHKADVLVEQIGYVDKTRFSKLLNEALDADKELKTAALEK